MAVVFFLSVAHHAANFWEWPALVMLAVFIATVPGMAWVIDSLIKRFAPRIGRIPAARLVLMTVFAILIGGFIAWRSYRTPADYQTLTITPVLSQDQTIALVELKADGHVVQVREAALASGWQEVEGILYATRASRAITISFRRMVNTPVSVLFLRSSRGGIARISFENERTELDLHGAEGGHVSVDSASRYRGLPNWIFVPVLVLADILAFGLLALAALLIQESGERSFGGSPAPEQRFPGHRAGLAVLLGMGIILHVLNALSTPLILEADSPAYLRGAVHWLEYGNLEGVPVFRGPGSAFLFAPVLLIFGRNPWGMKILLHLIGIACIPVSYRLGWQVGGRRWLAFTSGLFAVLLPEMYHYSNSVMSDLPNLFLVLVFCTLLISAQRKPGPVRMTAALLVASFATLLRPENVMLLLIALFFLAIPPGHAWLRAVSRKNNGDGKPAKLLADLGVLGLAFVIASLPLLWWGMHHQRQHGFVSLGNHSGIVLYDGWVYFGDASKLSFSDPDSPAIREIDAALAQYPVEISDRTGVPTSMEILPGLLRAGYSEYQAFELMEDAAWDSIRRDPALTLKLLFIKISAGLRPDAFDTATYSLPGEPVWSNDMKREYFDVENVSIPPLIGMQRTMQAALNQVIPVVQPVWVMICLAALALSLFRSPSSLWIALVLITATRLFVPQIMGLASWRYTLAGWIPLNIIAVSWVFLIVRGIKTLVGPDPGGMVQ